MEFNFFDVIVTMGALQGFVTALLLLFKFKKNRSNQYLGWILLFVSLACLNIVLLETLVYQSFFLTISSYIVPLIIIMPIGPLVYLYTLSFVHPQRRNLKQATFLSRPDRFTPKFTGFNLLYRGCSPNLFSCTV